MTGTMLEYGKAKPFMTTVAASVPITIGRERANRKPSTMSASTLRPLEPRAAVPALRPRARSAERPKQMAPAA